MQYHLCIELLASENKKVDLTEKVKIDYIFEMLVPKIKSKVDN